MCIGLFLMSPLYSIDRSILCQYHTVDRTHSFTKMNSQSIFWVSFLLLLEITTPFYHLTFNLPYYRVSRLISIFVGSSHLMELLCHRFLIFMNFKVNPHIVCECTSIETPSPAIFTSFNFLISVDRFPSQVMLGSFFQFGWECF